MAKKIIDVSVHNGTIDWIKVKASGQVDGAIIRCGYGSNILAQDDGQFERNYKEATRVGIPVGVYLYSYARNDSEANSELAHIIRLCKGKTLTLGVWLDCEEWNTRSYAPRCCEIVLEGLKKAGYQRVGVYANTSWFNNYLPSVTKYPRWVAQYYYTCTYAKSKIMWQFTSSATVSGINHKVDMSYLYDESWLKPLTTSTTTSKPATTTTIKTTATSKTKFAVSGKVDPVKDKVYFKAVTTAALNMRTWADSTNNKNIMRVLPNNKAIDVYDMILGSDGKTWYYIKADGKYGFVHSSYVKKK